MQATVAPLVSSWTRSVRAWLFCRFCGKGIFTPAIRLMTIRTCSRSAAVAEETAAPITSALANASTLTVCDMRDPFWQAGTRGCPTTAVALTHGERQAKPADVL